MGKVTALLTVAALGLGGYWAYDNRAWIAAELGLGELSPTVLRATDAAKSSYTLGSHASNYQILERQRRDSGGRTVTDWVAEEHASGAILVDFAYRVPDEEKDRRFTFEVSRSAQHVTLVQGDEALERKYGLAPPAEPGQ